MQFLLLVITKLVASFIIGWLIVPGWIVLSIPYSAIAAIYDGEPYRSAVWKRVKDSAAHAYFVGRSIGANIPSP